MSKKTIIGIAIAVIVALLVGYVVARTTSSGGATLAGGSGVPTVFDNVNLTGSLQTGVSVNNAQTLTTHGAGSLFANGTLGSSGIIYGATGVTEGGINSTSTPASLTLAATDIQNISLLNDTPTVGSVTLTFPASSTLTSYLANPGDSDTFAIFNATSTSGVNLTISGGTGTLLKNASSTAVITPGSVDLVTVIRKVNTDFLIILTPAM